MTRIKEPKTGALGKYVLLEVYYIVMVKKMVRKK